MLILTEERLPADDVRISPESYALRKETAEKRMESMIRYVSNDKECRSVSIQRYFGEQDATDCGVCDVCLARRQQTAQPDEGLRTRILEALRREPCDVKTLVSGIGANADRLVEAVTALLDERKIIEGKDGKLRINR